MRAPVDSHYTGGEAEADAGEGWVSTGRGAASCPFRLFPVLPAASQGPRVLTSPLPGLPPGHQCPPQRVSNVAAGWRCLGRELPTEPCRDWAGPCASNDGRTHVGDFERKGSSLSGLEGAWQARGHTARWQGERERVQTGGSAFIGGAGRRAWGFGGSLFVGEFKTYEWL